jgi:hypothetical protein
VTAYRFVADENFDGRVIRSLLRDYPDTDIVRVQDTEFYTAPDPSVLEWAANEGRIILTHDIRTMVGFAHDRIRLGLPMPGMIAVRRSMPIRRAIADLTMMVGASEMSEWANRVIFLPL